MTGTKADSVKENRRKAKQTLLLTVALALVCIAGSIASALLINSVIPIIACYVVMFSGCLVLLKRYFKLME